MGLGWFCLIQTLKQTDFVILIYFIFYKLWWSIRYNRYCPRDLKLVGMNIIYVRSGFEPQSPQKKNIIDICTTILWQFLNNFLSLIPTLYFWSFFSLSLLFFTNKKRERNKVITKIVFVQISLLDVLMVWRDFFC